MKKLIVVIEGFNREFLSDSLTLLAAVKSLGVKGKFKAAALVLADSQTVADKAAQYCDEVYAVVSDNFKTYDAHYTADVVSAVLKKDAQSSVIAMSSVYSDEYLPLASVLSARVFIPNCESADVQDEGMCFLRYVLSGSVVEKVCSGEAPFAATMTGLRFVKSLQLAKKEAKLSNVAAPQKKEPYYEYSVEHTPQKDPFSKVKVIIAGGAPFADKKSFDKIVAPLNRSLGGMPAVTSGALRNGVYARSNIVGQSGFSVSPKVYIAAGVSGQSQHLAGIRNCGCVIAVNTDENAPVFLRADYGVKGDVYRILHVLGEKISKIARM